MAIYFEKRLNIDTALTNRLLLVGNKQPMLLFVAVRAKKTMVSLMLKLSICVFLLEFVNSTFSSRQK